MTLTKDTKRPEAEYSWRCYMRYRQSLIDNFLATLGVESKD